MESKKLIRAFWFSSNNFGDNINSYLISELSGKEVCISQDKEHYIVCGSILSSANEYSTVWGAGFDWEHHNYRNIHSNSKIIAVRGDLSAARCGRNTVVIGDPCLLLPMLYRADEPKVLYKTGIIPHWSNIERCIELFPGSFIINPLLPMHIFIDKIRMCEYIFSESLHGLIVSDAFKIKNKWVNLGGQTGDGFKYRDYYSTTNSSTEKPISSLENSACFIHDYKYNLDTFLNSCPFYNGKYS